jgi:MYXO-CTERM domain-containing protein
MKKALALLVIGFMATSASASIVSMDFGDGVTEVTVSPSDSVMVHVYLDVFGTDDPLGAEMVGAFQATFLEALGVQQNDAMPLDPTWQDDSTGGPLDQSAQQINWARAPEGRLYSGEVVEIGTVELHVMNFDVDPWQIAFWSDFSFPRSDTGAQQTFNPGFAADRYAGYYDFGTGGPDSPLLIYSPEPASLALLALGGFAALRRRR